MKTVYTDKYAILPWVFALLTIWLGYKGFVEDSGWFQVFTLLTAAFWAYSAINEISRRRAAVHAGSDPSIYKVVDNAPNK